MRSDKGFPGMTAVSNGFREGPLASAVSRIGWPIYYISRQIGILNPMEEDIPLAFAPSNCLIASAASSLSSYVTNATPSDRPERS